MYAYVEEGPQKNRLE